METRAVDWVPCISVFIRNTLPINWGRVCGLRIEPSLRFSEMMRGRKMAFVCFSARTGEGSLSRYIFSKYSLSLSFFSIDVEYLKSYSDLC